MLTKSFTDETANPADGQTAPQPEPDFHGVFSALVAPPDKDKADELIKRVFGGLPRSHDALDTLEQVHRRRLLLHKLEALVCMGEMVATFRAYAFETHLSIAAVRMDSFAREGRQEFTRVFAEIQNLARATHDQIAEGDSPTLVPLPQEEPLRKDLLARRITENDRLAKARYETRPHPQDYTRLLGGFELAHKHAVNTALRLAEFDIALHECRSRLNHLPQNAYVQRACENRASEHLRDLRHLQSAHVITQYKRPDGHYPDAHTLRRYKLAGIVYQ